ncbi:MAG: nicotinamidase, partial [Pseudomonas sp.]|nr:nicotinamidase [Pseudomonas sp.]
MKIASFDVDAQNGFTANAPQELPVPGGHLIAPALNTMGQRTPL